MSRISNLATVINAQTSYTITQYPDLVDYGYNLFPPKDSDRELGIDIETYELVIKAESLANLETSITALLQTSSNYPTGYQFTTTGYPIWLDCKVVYKNWDTVEFLAVIEFYARWVI